MAGVWSIYILKDPRTHEVRYVGMTHGVRRRFAEHLYSTKRTRTRVASWIQSLLKIGLKPVLEEIETGRGEWAERERFWIAEYRRHGSRLTNHTDGGEGTVGWNPGAEWRKAAGERARKNHTGSVRSQEARANMKAAQQRIVEQRREAGVVLRRAPFSPEHLQKMAESQRGKKASPEARARMSAAKFALPPEVRQEISRKGADGHSAECKRWFAKCQLGKKKSPETRARMSAAAKQRWSKRKGEVTP